ncbi:hypothetical protein ACWGF3_00570 [Streptomyces xanthophaeus]|uniref:hypothetical protein n=1 Tax=Streptomyces xanthophaeus TaxID=67385 RepID=UPI0004CDD9EC|nr:hypothetical protein [Streptomyces xanthophaeus]WCD90804.1 hypothetical protein KPP03845_107233 [Streptomyces xanthophaeus]
MSMGTVIILGIVVAMITALVLAPPAGRTASEHGTARHRRGSGADRSSQRRPRRLRTLPQQRTSDLRRTAD